MRAAYATAASGYVALWPPADLGADLAAAAVRAGAHADTVGAARGFALVNLATGAPEALPPERTLAEARVLAARRSSPTLVLAAVARGRLTVWRRLEVVAPMELADAARRRCRLVAPNGVLVDKAMNPRRPSDLQALADQLAGSLRTVDREVMQPRIRAYLDRLDIDLTDAAARDRAFAEADRWLRSQGVRPIAGPWVERLTVSLNTVADGTRQRIKEQYLPRIGASLAAPDRQVVGQIAAQQGWFLRDQLGRVSTGLTNRGRKIVAAGVEQGLGRMEIARQLQTALPGLADQYGRGYAATVAANAVSRARSYAEVASYAEAGIEYLEVVAVLDERTTDICRYMDGQVISVRPVQALIQQAAAVTDPEDIYSAAPFIGSKGGTLATRNGTKLAETVRSGVGVANDRGQFAAARMGSQLPKAKVGAPPYHHRCRSMTVPRVEMVAVPAGYEALARSEPPAPEVLQQRPLDLVQAPAPQAPAALGTEVALDRLPLNQAIVGPPSELGDIAARAIDRPDSGYAFRTWAPEPSGRPTWVSPAQWRPIRATSDAANRVEVLANHPFGVGPTGQTDGICRLYSKYAGAPLQDNVDIAGVLCNEQVTAKRMLVRITNRKGEDVWCRIDFSKRPDWFASESAAAVFDAEDAIAAANGVVEDAIDGGWLVMSRHMDEVAKPLAQRVEVLPVPFKNKKVVVPKPAKLPPLKKPPKAPAPPIPGDIPPAPVKDGLRKVPVSDAVFGARPAVEQVLEDAFKLSPGRARIATVGGDGTLATGAGWTKPKVSVTSLRGLPDVDTLPLKPTNNHVTLFLRNDMRVTASQYNGSAREMMANILETEARRGHAIVRDWQLMDSAGNALYLRADGAALSKLSWQEVDALKKAIKAGDTKGNAWKAMIKKLRKAGLQVETRLADFYPNAVVDWSKPNWIYGVDTDVQVKARVDAVRAELDQRIAKLTATRQYINDPDYAVYKALHEALDEGKGGGPVGALLTEDITARKNAALLNAGIEAEKVGGTAKLVDKATANKLIDGAVAHTSPSIRAAMQTRPRPIIVGVVDAPKFRAFHSTAFGSVYEEAAAMGTAQAEMTPTMIAIRQTEQTRVVRHEMQHYLDTLGKNNEAAIQGLVADMKDMALPRDIYANKKEWALCGDWPNEYDGKVYGPLARDLKRHPKTPVSREKIRAKLRANPEYIDTTEYMSTASDAFTHGSPVLAAVYKRSPRQIELYIAMMRGAFVPF